jgi:predicted SAM-dependent methyltransferase
MNLKFYLVKKFQREGLFYSIIDETYFKLLKWKNYLVNGHILRKNIIKNYYKKSEKKKIHFGAGKKRIKTFLNSDIMGKCPIDITKKLPFKNNSIDIIYSNHLIEHIYLKNFKFFLKECKRVLKKGGIIIIQTPSLEKIARELYNNKNNKNKKFILETHKKYSLEKQVTSSSYMNDVMHICFGHKYLYDYELFSNLTLERKFKKISKVEDNISFPDSNLYEELKKYKKEHKFWDLVTESFIIEK